MATLPEHDLFADDHSCFSLLDLCEEHEDHRPTNRIATPLPFEQYSENRNEMKETEDFLAADLNTLSAQERSEALDDVHCVGEELHETPEETQEALAEFDRLVQMMRNPIYEVAVSQNRAYVEDPSFRLMFLRANSYDVAKAVHQMMNLLQQKAMYFGNDRVAREITLDDLKEEDQRLMLDMCHIQEGKDQMGRVISYWFPFGIFRTKNLRADSMARAIYYLAFNILLRIPELQTKGMVSVQYDTKNPGENFGLPKMSCLMAITNFTKCLPFRYTATHCCIQATGGSAALYNTFVGFFYRSLPKEARARIRIHNSSHMELQYNLRGYGIPTDTFPVDMNGIIRKDIIHKWFHNHLQSLANGQHGDQGAVGVATTERPRGFTDKDILLGRGRLVQYHPGNVQFREFLEVHMEEYDKANRPRRRKIASDLVRELRASGVRFLKSIENDEWAENDFEDSVDKVAQFYRTKRRSIKKSS